MGCLGLAGWFFCWPPLEPGAVRWQLGLEAHLGWKSKMASPSRVWCLIAPLWPPSPHVISFSRSFLCSKVIRLPEWWLASKNTRQNLLGLLTASSQHWHCILLSKPCHRTNPESVRQRTAPGHQYQAARLVGWGGAPK